MRGLLEAREKLKRFYGNYSLFINKAGQFLLALIVFWAIGQTLGYFDLLTNPVVLIALALICMFLPINFTVFVSAALVLAHLYKLSLEIMGVTAAVMLILFILYFRFVPKQAVIVLLMPLLFGLKIPYLMPIALGLVSSPVSIFACACGTIMYYLLNYVSTYAATMSTAEEGSALTRIEYFTRNLIQNKEMFLVIVAFAIVILLVYAIRRLSVDHAWPIAIGAGLVINFLVFVIGHIVMDISVSYSNLIFGSVISLVVAIILQFFFFTVDYSRTRKVQYEDDEYYYYVKAVPKVSVSPKEKKVKQIHHWKEENSSRDSESEGKNS